MKSGHGVFCLIYFLWRTWRGLRQRGSRRNENQSHAQHDGDASIDFQVFLLCCIKISPLSLAHSLLRAMLVCSPSRHFYLSTQTGRAICEAWDPPRDFGPSKITVAISRDYKRNDNVTTVTTHKVPGAMRASQFAKSRFIGCLGYRLLFWRDSFVPRPSRFPPVPANVFSRQVHLQTQ